MLCGLKAFIFPPCISFVRTGNPEPQPVFFFGPLANKDLFLLKQSWDPKHLKIIAVVNEGAKVLDICTTLMGLPDLASDGSPLPCGTHVTLRMSVV